MHGTRLQSQFIHRFKLDPDFSSEWLVVIVDEERDTPVKIFIC